MSNPRLEPPFTKPTKPSTASHAPLPNGQTSPKPPSNSASSPKSTPLAPLESLPTIFSKKGSSELANDDIQAFLEVDLNLERLNRIHRHLWMAGRPLRAHPLHRYKMLRNDFVHTQQLDLHIVKFSTSVIIKPLPEWILDYEFWQKHLCDDEKLHKAACGFIVSYIWLVITPIDLKIAHDHDFLPESMTWPKWKAFVTDVYKHIDMNILDQVNERFHFGDLRLGRINSIYRIRHFHTHFVRGYLYGYNRYVVFFQRKFSWILIVFVFFSLVLSAMQVGVSLDPLSDNRPFLETSYGFVVFSIVSVAALLAVIGGLFVTIFIFNMIDAINHVKRVKQKRERLAKERDEKKHTP